MEARWTPRRQGDFGELSAILWCRAKAAAVFVPLGHTPSHYDFIADFGHGAVRVQVKTSTCWRSSRWYVTLSTRGGNRSWSGLIKLLDPTKCDVLFVHVGDGRRWYIPTSVLEGGSKIVLGGPKYAEFEVESGAPLPTRTAPEPSPSS